MITKKQQTQDTNYFINHKVEFWRMKLLESRKKIDRDNESYYYCLEQLLTWQWHQDPPCTDGRQLLIPMQPWTYPYKECAKYAG
jgi:hypothetical protein